MTRENEPQNRQGDTNPWLVIGKLCVEAVNGNEQASLTLDAIEEIQLARSAMIQAEISKVNTQMEKLNEGLAPDGS